MFYILLVTNEFILDDEKEIVNEIKKPKGLIKWLLPTILISVHNIISLIYPLSLLVECDTRVNMITL